MTVHEGCSGRCPSGAIDYSSVHRDELVAVCGRRWERARRADGSLGGWIVVIGGTPCAPRSLSRPWSSER